MNTKSKTKIFLVLILWVLLYQKINLAQQYWESLQSPTTENLNALCFTDSLVGWVAGFSGTILHTTNGGNNWVFQNTQTENNIEDIYFIDRNIGWAIYWEVFNPPYGTYILSTTDGGNNWVRSDFPQENIFSKCIIFLDSLYGWMGGKPYPIVRTIDGGLTWSEAEIDSSTYSYFPVYDIQFYNSKYGYASGGAVDCCGVLWWTTNSGDHWEVIDTPFVAPEPIYQIFTFDSVNVLGVGGDFEALGFGVGMIETSDGGDNWNFEYIGISGVAWDIDFRTINEAWAPLGGEQKLMYSFDSGTSWATVPTPDNSIILKIAFPDSIHGFGVGLNGAIIKYNSGINSSFGEESNLTNGYELEQNYPNPFNPSTNIKFYLPSEERVELKVYDILGNEVAILISDELTSGNHEITFDAVKKSGGVYFYTLFTSKYAISKKMILLR